LRGPHNIWRLIRTGATLERTGAMKVILDAAEAPALMRGALRGLVWPFQWLGLKGDVNLPPVTRALQALGPAYIKFGQVLSTRPDVVGTELAVQLRVLQDKLPPFPIEVAKAEIEKELGVNIDTVFADFSEPVAAASIAQVHKARLVSDGELLPSKSSDPVSKKHSRKT
jgi:ubiquinone biosynthesis protein